jgi:hypothetical protein
MLAWARQTMSATLATGAWLALTQLGCGDERPAPSSAGGASSGAGAANAGAAGTGPGSAGTASGSGGAAGSAGAAGGQSGSTGTTSNAGSAGEGGSAGAPPSGVTIDGRGIFVDGAAFHIRGVCWNPVPRGGAHPADLDFAGAAEQDLPLMAAAGVNAVRTYEPLTDRTVLDALYAAGIRVLNTVYPYGGNSVDSAVAAVDSVKDHPALLMWVVGNEWNYNGLYVDLPHAAALARVNEVAAAIRAADPAHPISTVYGELPSADTLAAMPDIDVWGLNVYRGIGFGMLFEDFAARSSKPFYLAEYGADAWNANIGSEDLESQAEAVSALTELIWQHGAAHSASGTCAGGTVFEWADEWWKDASGSRDAHDVGGIAPGGGPYPDQTFNEEWWGLVDVDRRPRPAYHALAAVYTR